MTNKNYITNIVAISLKMGYIRNRIRVVVLVCILLGSLFIVPLFEGNSINNWLWQSSTGDNKTIQQIGDEPFNNIETLQEFLAGNEDKNVPVGEEPSEGEAYHYWYAPENSFGTSYMKTVNWSYFWELFKDHSAWQLEAWHWHEEN